MSNSNKNQSPDTTSTIKDDNSKVVFNLGGGDTISLNELNKIVLDEFTLLQINNTKLAKSLVKDTLKKL